MNFSIRYGFKTIRKEFQSESIDESLKNSLWNVIYKTIRFRIDSIYDDLIIDFFKVPLDIQDSTYSTDLFNTQKINSLKQKFYKLEWYEIYDFIEFIINLQHFNYRDKETKRSFNDFKQKINYYLEKESSAYRLVGNIFTRILDEIEIESIEESITTQQKKFFTIKIHLNEALKKLSDKKSPDYRNSIKESITAVEACCRILTNESTLGKSLAKLENKGIYINPQLKNGIEKIYAYTNSKESGIRHAIIENTKEPDFEDAKYMLVSCCTFVNYLISKYSKIQ